jgi:hypothetical protein
MLKLGIKKKHVVFDIDDIVEIIFGSFVGLFFFLGASELWAIGARLTDASVMFIAIVNIGLLYSIMRFITGRTASAILLESVDFPLSRTAIVYAVGFSICYLTISGLESLGVLGSFVTSMSTGVVPAVVKISIFANLMTTIIGSTVDLSLSEKN